MSRIASNISLVCYDITSDRLRRKIDMCMKDFGVRLQYSVFLCRLDEAGLLRCREKLMKLLKQYHKDGEARDSVVIFRQIDPYTADSLIGDKIECEPSEYLIC